MFWRVGLACGGRLSRPVRHNHHRGTAPSRTFAAPMTYDKKLGCVRGRQRGSAMESTLTATIAERSWSARG